jgi:hypothetical protein
MGGDKMHYEAILMNPPYNVGNKVTSTAIETCCKCVCLMPLSQYKSNNLYRHVEDFRLADPEMFEDADITNNLCICTLRKDVVDKFKTYEEMAMESYDPKFKAFYEVNSKLGCKCYMIQKNYEPIKNFSIDIDFIESNRCYSASGGAGFGQNGFGWKYNVLKDFDKKDTISMIGWIHFQSKKEKDNFCKYWYNGSKGKSLSSKALLGLHTDIAGKEHFMAIPQIDWEAISDTQLWKEGKYDEAVLLAMHLRWNDKKDGVVRSN